ncbi:GNAT family N-acetyltransferase [Lysobacter sp. TY2-98]|uniref:GNAT family N-acetyltransferase n=1 Tax=Lysobacter sp. TY2-98 TaxID=2290922 RepID=UPI001965C1F3|nr:GNAT family N-acetyltransferase [Lysobacter sp. TY2-98]
MADAIVIVPFAPGDRDDWQRLAEGYKAFYATPTASAEYDAAWARLLDDEAVHGLGAKVDGRLVGIVHFLFHATVWAERTCYLQDLFTDEAARGRGVARALIEAVAHEASEREATRMYWLTQAHNATARALYDRVAVHRGFIRYDYPLA